MQKLKEDIKEKIKNAGVKLFKENGFENTSIKDIAKDAGVSTGNIYRYFLTKKHLLNEILAEVEQEIREFLDNIPMSYDELEQTKIFNILKDEIVNLAMNKREALIIMFNCENQRLFIDFRNRILELFTDKVETMLRNTKNSIIDLSICGAIARSLFEGFTYIVKENIQNIEKLEKNLAIFNEIILVDLDKRILGVINNDR